MTGAIVVRPLRAGDVSVLAGVLTRAYTSHQNFRWRLHAYLQTPTVATFVAEVEGQPVGMVVGNDYGSIAYVAQMAVDPPLQRRGIGAALMDALIAWADDRRFPALELDATPAGEPLYARYGFVTSGETQVYFSTANGGDGGAARRYAVDDGDALLAADMRAFGADRSDVLRQLIDSPQTVVFVYAPDGEIDGFAIAQPQTEMLGPVVAPSATAAAALLDAARAHLPASHRLCLPAENRAARTIVAQRGYRFSRSLAHMVRGTLPRAARDSLYARINLGQG